MPEINTVWSNSWIQKTGKDPRRIMNLVLGRFKPWRVLVLYGEHGRIFGPDSPEALEVIPQWQAVRNNLQDLRHLFAAGGRFAVTPPSLKTKDAQIFIPLFRKLTVAFPTARPHLHGSYSYPVLFGIGAASVDIDPRTQASRGSIILPNGRTMRRADIDALDNDDYWLRVIGYSRKDLNSKKALTEFNIESASWAALNWNTLDKSKLEKAPKLETLIDPTEKVTALGRGNAEWRRRRAAELVMPDIQFRRPQTKTALSPARLKKAKTGDKVICDTCSLAAACKFFREGAVCGLPDTQGKEWGDYFGTRDSGSIIDGMGVLVAATARRAQGAMKKEDRINENNPDETYLDPELTKVMAQALKAAGELAKFVDPTLRPGPAAQILIQQRSTGEAIASARPAEVVASARRALMAQGIPANEITGDDIKAVVSAMANMNGNGQFVNAGEQEFLGSDDDQPAIEGTIVP
jgi:hypothetical protein